MPSSAPRRERDAGGERAADRLRRDDGRRWLGASGMRDVAAKGIPAIDFTSDVSYPIHTPLDNWANFNPDGLPRTGDLVLRLFERFDGGVHAPQAGAS